MGQVITCPSGLTGRIRGMKVKEERVLTDRKLARTGGQVDELLAACWEETLDPGPYDLGGRPLDWGKVLQGDRFFALLQVRAHTYGATYGFSVGCRADSCRAKIDWELDLASLPVRPLSDASRAAFLDGNRFEATLADAGKKVWFRLLTGDDERKLPAVQRASPERVLSSMLSYRVLEVDGVDPRHKRAFLEDLSLRDADALLDELDRVDCGVDTTIEIECPTCLLTQDIELPFDRGFFLPGRERTRRRLERISSSPG